MTKLEDLKEVWIKLGRRCPIALNALIWINVSKWYPAKPIKRLSSACGQGGRGGGGGGEGEAGGGRRLQICHL